MVRHIMELQLRMQGKYYDILTELEQNNAGEF
jgi:hypothetical protein